MLQYQSGNLYAEQQMKNYIQSSLIPRMTMLDTTRNFEVSSKLRNEMHEIFKGKHAHLLHEAMIPFYEKYIHLDSEIFDHSHISLELEISDLMKIDRMNGYLSYSRVKGDTMLNNAKMAEISERKSM